MMRIVAIVEGPGDVKALPTLVAKTGDILGHPCSAPLPIKAGEWKKLRREGELERTLTLAASRGWDLILLALDLDDGCALKERESIQLRIDAWKNGRNIRVESVFFTKEYETMFLHFPECMTVTNPLALPGDPEAIRGAKERIKLLTGTRYKEPQHQVEFTKRLNLEALFDRSRSYRRFCKALSGLDYPILRQIM